MERNLNKKEFWLKVYLQRNWYIWLNKDFSAWQESLLQHECLARSTCNQNHPQIYWQSTKVINQIMLKISIIITPTSKFSSNNQFRFHKGMISALLVQVLKELHYSNLQEVILKMNAKKSISKQFWESTKLVKIHQFPIVIWQWHCTLASIRSVPCPVLTCSKPEVFLGVAPSF